MLDILVGSRPLAELPDDSKKDAVKQNVLKILNEKYGIEEEDFLFSRAGDRSGRKGKRLWT